MTELCTLIQAQNLLSNSNYSFNKSINSDIYWYESFSFSPINSSHILPTVIEHYCQDYFPKVENPIKLFIDSKLLIPVIIIVFITNICICLVLTKPHMVSPTNIILTSIAIADSLTGLFPLPFYFMKNLKFYSSVINKYFGYFFYYNVIVLPTVLHTISIWLTVSLAVQRYIYVKLPTKSKDLCSIRKSVYTILAIIVISTAFHLQLAIVTFDYYYKYRCQVTDNIYTNITRNLILMKCNWKPNLLIYYYWSRTVLTNVIPCILLTVFTLSLIFALQAASRHRQSLLQSSQRKESRRTKEFYSTSKMLLIVLCLFLLVEIPNGMLITFYMVVRTFYSGLMKNYQTSWTKLNLICNASIIFSYPLNFFIYCTMSRNFRETFKYIFGFTSSPDIVANVSVVKSHVRSLKPSNVNNNNNNNVATVRNKYPIYSLRNLDNNEQTKNEIIRNEIVNFALDNDHISSNN